MCVAIEIPGDPGRLDDPLRGNAKSVAKKRLTFPQRLMQEPFFVPAIAGILSSFSKKESRRLPVQCVPGCPVV